MFCKLPQDIQICILARLPPHYVIGDKVLDMFIVRNKIYEPKALKYIIKRSSVNVFMTFIETILHDENMLHTILLTCIKNKEITKAFVLVKRFGHVFVNGKLRSRLITRLLWQLSRMTEKKDMVIYCKFLHYTFELSDDKIYATPDIMLCLLQNTHQKYIFWNLISSNVIQVFSHVSIDERADLRFLLLTTNNIGVLSFFLKNGYNLREVDFAIGFLLSDIQMVAFMCKFFKPRYYTLSYKRMINRTLKKRCKQIQNTVSQRFS